MDEFDSNSGSLPEQGKAELIWAHVEIGYAHAASNLWERAAQHLEAAVALERSVTFSANHFRLMPMLLLAGDRSARQRHFSSLYQRFADSSSPEVLDRIAKAWLVEPLEGEDLARAVGMAENALARGKDSVNQRYFQVCVGLALYRSGKFAEAVSRLEKLGASTNERDVAVKAPLHFVLALACHRLGMTDRARANLLTAQGIFAGAFAGPASALKRTGPDELFAEALRREAVSTISANYPIDFGSGDFTIAAWIMTTAKDGAILSKADATGSWSPGARVLAVKGGALAYDVHGVKGLQSTLRVDDGNWRHVAVTHCAAEA